MIPLLFWAEPDDSPAVLVHVLRLHVLPALVGDLDDVLRIRLIVISVLDLVSLVWSVSL